MNATTPESTRSRTIRSTSWRGEHHHTRVDEIAPHPEHVVAGQRGHFDERLEIDRAVDPREEEPGAVVEREPLEIIDRHLHHENPDRRASPGLVGLGRLHPGARRDAHLRLRRAVGDQLLRLLPFVRREGPGRNDGDLLVAVLREARDVERRWHRRKIATSAAGHSPSTIRRPERLRPPGDDHTLSHSHDWRPTIGVPRLASHDWPGRGGSFSELSGGRDRSAFAASRSGRSYKRR